MWVARYLLERTAESYGLAIDYHPKPLGATDWNGSGMPANFSNSTLRTCGDQKTYEKICEAFRPVVKEHIDVYGADNDQRLTGEHETQSITEVKYVLTSLMLSSFLCLLMYSPILFLLTHSKALSKNSCLSTLPLT